MKYNFRNAASLEKLSDLCDKHGASYNPGNPSIGSSALKSLLAEAKNAIQAERMLQADLDEAIGLRKKAFRDLPLFVTRFVSTAEASGISKEQLDKLRRIAARFRSKPFKGDSLKSEPPPSAAPVAESSTRFNRQLRSDVMAGSFADLISGIEKVSAYAPKEDAFTIEGLKSKLAELERLNARVAALRNELSIARNKRNLIMFDGNTGIPAVVRMVKAYFRGLFGTTSSEVKSVNAIKVRSF